MNRDQTLALLEHGPAALSPRSRGSASALTESAPSGLLDESSDGVIKAAAGASGEAVRIIEKMLRIASRLPAQFLALDGKLDGNVWIRPLLQSADKLHDLTLNLYEAASGAMYILKAQLNVLINMEYESDDVRVRIPGGPLMEGNVWDRTFKAVDDAYNAFENLWAEAKQKLVILFGLKNEFTDARHRDAYKRARINLDAARKSLELELDMMLNNWDKLEKSLSAA